MARNLLTILLFFLCVGNINAENVDSTALDTLTTDTLVLLSDNDGIILQEYSYKDTEYWERYRMLKGYAWAALGAGIIGLPITSVLTLVSGLSNPGGNVWTKVFIGGMFVSMCLPVVSIPLFIISHHNKKKALRTSISASSISLNMPTTLKTSQPAIAFQICF